MPDGWVDDQPVARLLAADYRVWDDPAVEWETYDRVVLRSVWDYTQHFQDFVAWCRAIGAARLRNRPEMVAWNSDKRYLADLGVATVPTVFVEAGDAIPPLAGEVVIKPSVSAGALDTGRFAEGDHDDARRLIARIHASGRIALIQPHLPGIDRDGETSLVFIGGELSHVLAKRPILRASGEAPLAPAGVRVAAVYLEPDLVRAGSATPEQRELAQAVHAEVADRFGCPVYARVDLIPGPDGRPAVLELELIEPNLYLASASGAAERLERAIRES